MPGMVGTVVRSLALILGPIFNIPNEESGSHHLFFATSDCYPPEKMKEEVRGVSKPDGLHIARGIDGVKGSGMYCIDQKGESACVKVEELITNYMKDGTADKVWQQTLDEWNRILQ